MGYTHYWAYQPSHPAYARAWPAILADTRAIINRVRQAGIVIADPDGHHRPILDDRDGVGFNGDATSDLDAEAFQLLAPLPTIPAGTPTATAFCKTNRNPYDLAVASVLLRMALLLPDVFALASDGEWEREWKHGAMAWHAHQPAGLGARTVVADLLGIAPVHSPLRDRLDRVRFDVDPR
jgi:hypothetical protein